MTPSKYLFLAVAGFLAGNSGVQAEYPPGYVPAKPSTTTAPAPTSSCAANTTFLDQGWSPELRELVYHTPQGSRLMPYSWFLALEQPSGGGKFTAPDYLSKFGLLIDGKSSLNPDGLPVGFAKDPTSLPGTGQWVGLNCSTCHTGEVSYQGKKFRVEGAPTQADIGAFLNDLALAVKTTRPSNPTNDPKKFERFATSVYGHPPSAEELSTLTGLFEEFAVKLEGETWMRNPPYPAGAARIDALGQIINALAVFDLREPDNLRPPAAPVSYPFLWLAPKLDFVQWVPVASSPISRNGGEVLGVFAHVDFTSKTNPLGSSMLLKQLDLMEEWFDMLSPPAWPKEVLGAVDATKAARGKELFTQDCLGCHTMPPYRMSPKEANQFGKQFIQINRTPFMAVGTDPTYTLDLITRTTRTGALKDMTINGKSIFDGKPVVSGAEFFLGSVGATLEQAFIDQKVTLEDAVKYNGYRFCSNEQSLYCPQPNMQGQLWSAPADAAVSLKSGPLFGMWATGPFLHNGSVPNIYELLSPPPERSKVFWVGSIELDPVKLGFKATEKDLTAEERAKLFRFDTSVPGNGNQGHVYPPKGYSHEDRMAMIEYLKDPGDWK